MRFLYFSSNERLADKNKKIKYEILWVFSNITVGDSDKANAILDAGFSQIFPTILEHGNSLVVEQTIWVISNICGDSKTPRNTLLETGFLELIQKIHFEDMSMSVISNIAWLMSNIFRTRPFPSYGKISDTIPILRTLLKFCWDDSVLIEFLWSLSHITDLAPAHFINSVIEDEFLDILVKSVTHTRVDIQTPAIRTIGNLVSGEDFHTQQVLNAGVLQHVTSVLKSTQNSILREACWLISNICCGTRQQIQEVMDSKILHILMEMSEAASGNVQREIYWAFANISTSCSKEQIGDLIDIGITRKLVDGLRQTNARLQTSLVNGLVILLEHGEVMSKNGGYNLAALDFGQRGLTAVQSIQNLEPEVEVRIETIKKILAASLKTESRQ